MIVTDKEYHLDDKYVSKLDLLVKRIQGTDDVVLPIDGDEGQGKTELAFGTCYYVAHKTGRNYDIDHIFFDLDKMISFAVANEDQIIHFDEAALGLLTTNWQNKIQQKFIKLVMVARKKRHFIILCIPKFHRLPQYLIEERSIGLVHVYSQKNIKKGRFCYFIKKKKDMLYIDWKKSKQKKYKDHFSFRGTFPEASKKIFTEEQRQAYEDKKDAAILSIGVDAKPEMSSLQKRQTKQRDELIVFIKNRMGFNYVEMNKELNKDGISDIDMEMARRAVRQHEISNSL